VAARVRRVGAHMPDDRPTVLVTGARPRRATGGTTPAR
jgi:hypothetical protein